ncbi:Sn1-specific diacylglycerol lipase alpha [Thecamonas trahens ATCC 50062]|uniref:sn-1-specific diacylglycerol lipase n=1 Tax=Thecamonas trahens ATCC 50062 TaxID=461836 RepID=A0A0L0DD77_THETB|nr:Sn1-specific diacylglycerol lipase alpha [Thecamonas trahens ATCC 50062]KNC50160.1 Sn1-specific diacylglycerol lipase alpha [Thecamonas trahens ATCC 50062]|eukprot:XP_013757002.1 Sn1-specific diacylglycerol lipase alpha [Thecamonas trahens ATCC 50062]
MGVCTGRWPFSSDDVLYPSMISALLRVVCVVPLAVLCHVLLVAPSATTRAMRTHCTSSGAGGRSVTPWELLEAWIVASLALFAISMALSLFAARLACKGSVLDPHNARGAVPPVLVMKAGVFVLEMGSAGIGSFLVWGTRVLQCEQIKPSLVAQLQGTMVLLWVVLLLSLCFTSCVYVSMGGRRAGGLSVDSYRKRWERRLKCMACIARGKEGYEPDLYGTSSLVLLKLFSGGDHDVVPSDVAAGLVALARDQRSNGIDVLTSNPAYLANDADALNGPPPEAELSLEAAAYFGRYSNASYGWPLYTLERMTKCCGCCHGPFCQCACMCSGRREAKQFAHGVEGDNCCGYNIGALHASLPPLIAASAELLHANYRNAVFQPAYFVAVDRARSTVVIAIRGTLSMEDTLTDAVASAVAVPEAFAPPVPGLAHDGILRAAAWVYSDVMEHVAGLGDTIRAALAEFGEVGSMVVVGHSLGAGTAALLTLRMRAEFGARVRCFAYACPAVMTLELARACAPFTVTALRGYDLVPRLSVRNTFELRENVMHALRRETANKHALLCGCAPLSSSMREGVARPGLVNESEALLSVRPMQRPVPIVRPRAAAATLLPGMDDADLEGLGSALYPPGRVLQVLAAANKGEYDYGYVDPAALDKVLAGKTMFLDHMPWKLFDALDTLT